MPHLHPRHHTAALTLCALLAAAPSAFALEAIFIGPPTATWQDPVNWSTNPAFPNSIYETARISSSATLTLTAPVTLAGITYIGTTPAILRAIATGALTLNAPSAVAPFSIPPSLPAFDILAPLQLASPVSLQAGANANFRAPISGPGPLSVTGTLTLSADNSFSGPLSLQNASVTAASISALGSPYAPTIVGPSSTLTLLTPVYEAITVNGGTLVASSPYAGSLALTAGSVLLQSGTSGRTSISGGTLTNTGPATRGFDLSGGTLIDNGPATSAYNLSGGILILNRPSAAPVYATSGAIRLTNTATPYINPLFLSGTLSSEVNITAAASSGTVTLASPINSSGTLTIDAGLGSTLNITAPLAATGFLTLNNSISLNAPLHVSGILRAGGDVAINAPATIDAFAFLLNKTTFNAPSSFSREVFFDYSDLTAFNQPASFAGALYTTVNVSINAPSSFDRRTFFRSYDPSYAIPEGSFTLAPGQTFRRGLATTASTFLFNGTNTANGPWLNNGGTLTLNASNTVDSLLLASGLVSISPSATLTSLAPDITLLAGTLTGSLSAASLVKSGSSAATASIAFNGSVLVKSGTLVVSGTASSYTVYPGASLTGTLTSSAPVYLLDAAGTNRAALFAASGYYEPFANSIDLGPVGSSIGAYGSGTTVDLAGPLSGGALTILSDGTYLARVRLSNSANTYTGPTTISSYAILDLRDAGRITTSSAINLNRGTLQIDNFSAFPGIDRVGDAIPIVGNGGTLSLTTGYTAASTIAETVGDFRVNRGLSTISRSYLNETVSSPSYLTLSSLTRTGQGATLRVWTDVGTYSSYGFRIYVASPPDVSKGILAPWLVVSDDSNAPSFATYDSTGISALVSPLADINTFSSTANAYTSTAFLASSRAVHSLRMTGGTLDLGGNTLTLNSGGLILYSNPTATLITHGALTATNGELFAWASGTINASIIDGTGGPLSLTVSRFGLDLGGANTYSGTTTINDGAITIRALSAFPAGGNVQINGGYLYFYFPNTSASLTLGNVSISSGGIPTVSTVLLSASSWTLDNAYLAALPTGAAPIAVNGAVTLNRSDIFSQHTGTITINAGGYLLAAAQATAASTILVLPGGTLTAGTLSGAHIALNGGLLLAPSTTASTHADIAVLADSTADSFSFTTPVTLAADASLALRGAISFTAGTAGPGSLRVAEGDQASITLTSASPRIAPLVIDGFARLYVPANSPASADSTGAISGTGHLEIPPGAVTSDAITLPDLTLLGTLTLRPNAGTSHLQSLELSPHDAASLDLTNNALILQSSSSLKSSDLQYLACALAPRPQGLPFLGGAGITSSTVAANANTLTLALFDNADLHLVTYDGQSLDDNSLLLLPALLGDANLDHLVDDADFQTWFTHVGSFANATSRGDFNLDNQIDLADYDAWYQHVGTPFPLLSPRSSALNTSSSPVPEPTSLALLLPAMLLLRRRRPHART